MKAKNIAVVVACLAVPAAIAQFAVVDVGNIAQAIQNGMTLTQQVRQMKDQYDHIVYQAQSLRGTVTQWASIHGVWRWASSADATGLNAAYLTAQNSGGGVAPAYGHLVGPTEFSLSGVPVALQDEFRRRMAATERLDGNIISSTSTLGFYTAMSPNYQARVQRLAASTTSDAPDDNTAAALQKQANAALMLQIEGNSTLAEIQRHNLQQQNELVMAHREQLSNQINSDVHFYQTAPTVLHDGTKKVTDDLRAMRLPD